MTMMRLSSPAETPEGPDSLPSEDPETATAAAVRPASGDASLLARQGPPTPGRRRVDYEKSRRALEHVLFDVAGFPPESLRSAVVAAYRDRDINSVDDLCRLTDEDVAEGTTGTTPASRRIDREKLRLLKAFRAEKRMEATSNGNSPSSSYPTSDDWLNVTPDEFAEFVGGIEAAQEQEEYEVPMGSSEAAQGRARQLAQAFVESILAQEPEPIPRSGGMSVLRDVVQLETGEASDLVIRKLTQPFWQACIDSVNTPGVRRRVCAVGTPGIGKTTSIPFLIRMLLLEQKKTVVYLVRTHDKDGYYNEFIPGPQTGNPVTVNVYPEQMKRPDIPSLSDPSTYYVVDPGETSDNCSPSSIFKPKVIIVASPNSKQWGGNEFEKIRGKKEGELKVFPVWELDELVRARPVLRPEMTEQQVMNRYSQVGGVPRHIFASGDMLANVVYKQNQAANGLTLEQAELIAIGDFPSLPTFDKSQPQSALIGFRTLNDSRFSRYTVDIIAPRVGARLYRRFMKRLWDKLQLPSPANPWLFEAYCRYLLGANRRLKFKLRLGVGKDHPDRSAVQRKLLGGCLDIRSAGDIVAAARNRHMVVFHPMNQSEKLIDFIYRDMEGHYHAFQVTLAKTHSANVTEIRKLEKRVGGPENLSLYYVVPEFRFNEFATNPVDPRDPPNGESASCNIYHISVPDPNPCRENNPGTRLVPTTGAG